MGTLELSAKERKRSVVLSRVKEGVLTLVKAAELLGLSCRQMKRVWKHYREEGDGGLAHRSRGRVSNRRIEEGGSEEGAATARGALPGLWADAGRRIPGGGHETLRRWLVEAGLWAKRRKRQKRRAYRGELIQMDGSHHDWFEGRGGWTVLMVMIEDAANRIYARFYEAETTWAAMGLFGRYAWRYGLPQALYVDRDSIYECRREARIEEALRGEGPQTQFGRAMKVLGVAVIRANSP